MSRCIISSLLGAMALLCGCLSHSSEIDLTVIPPGLVSDKVDLDLRYGISNHSDKSATYDVEVYTDDGLLYSECVTVDPGEVWSYKQVMPSGTISGDKTLTLRVVSNGRVLEKSEKISVVSFESRSIHRITGAWVGI